MQAALAQISPAGLGLASDPSFQLEPHIELIDHELVEATARSHERERHRPEILLVSVPPRHGKSTLISQLRAGLVSRHLPRSPGDPRLLRGRFAARWGMRARDLLQRHGEALLRGRS